MTRGVRTHCYLSSLSIKGHSVRASLRRSSMMGFERDLHRLRIRCLCFDECVTLFTVANKPITTTPAYCFSSLYLTSVCPEPTGFHRCAFGGDAPRQYARRTGLTSDTKNSAELTPRSMGAAIRFITSDPLPVECMMGIRPTANSIPVVNTGRSRSQAPSTTAVSETPKSFYCPRFW